MKNKNLKNNNHKVKTGLERHSNKTYDVTDDDVKLMLSYLNKYKRLERMLRDKNIDVKECAMLGMLSPKQSGNLDICRKLRNYYVHEFDTANQDKVLFIPTTACFDALDEIMEQIHSTASTEVSKSQVAVTSDMFVTDVIKTLRASGVEAAIVEDSSSHGLVIGIVNLEYLLSDFVSNPDIATEPVCKHLIPVHVACQVNVSSDYSAEEIIESARNVFAERSDRLTDDVLVTISDKVNKSETRFIYSL